MLCFALLMFFAGLVSVSGPVPRTESVNGYNIRTTFLGMQSSLDNFIAFVSSQDAGASNVTGTARLTAPKRLKEPFSLRIAWLTPWLIFAALACAALALLDFFLSQRVTPILGLVGGGFGTLAILHVITMTSDLRAWTEQLINSGSLRSVGNPLFLVQSYQLRPGPGLYGLTACLFLATLLSRGAIQRISRVIRREPRPKRSHPICVRPANARYPAEDATTLDVSRSGLQFESAANHYYSGMEVYVIRDLSPGGPANHGEHGSVVRVERLDGGKCRVAIRIIPAR